MDDQLCGWNTRARHRELKPAEFTEVIKRALRWARA
jgi:hypothetical protein